ncbi:MAG: extracellular solute-binding protein [Clostridia bacterium]|nr:extracellular solute-binding protein [Clostridia bacterium]
MKRFFVLLTLGLLIALWGCENVEYIEQSASKNDSSVDIYDQLQSEIPLPDTSGETLEYREFLIITDDSTAFYQDESTQGAVSTALEERNSFLRDTYGAMVKVVEKDFETIKRELAYAVESGTKYCDMISISAQDTVKLYDLGLLCDMNTLPNFSIENSYFKQDWATSLATNNSLYMLADPTAMVYDEAYVMFYNRNLVKEDIEALVMQGKWTWEEFDRISREAAKEVYSHSASDLNSDIFAFGAYELETVYPLAMWASCGNKLIDNTYKNPVGVGMEADAVKVIAEYLEDIYNVRGKYPLAKEDAATAFTEGRLAFFCHELNFLYGLRDGTALGDNYGFVPLPKYNAEQEKYHVSPSLNARVISVPKTVDSASEQEKAFISAVISATCAAGSSTMTDAYIKSRLSLYLNTNSETVMLKTICDSITFDFATVFGSGIEIIRTPTTKAIADYLDYGSKLSSSLRKGKQAFEKYCEEHFK